MFGVLRPALGHVSPANKQLYHAAYCNLCASLSASGAGTLNRFFLIHDVVTIDWLLTEDDATDQHPFSCANCVKGGVIGKTHRVSAHQTFLAALSTYMCGVKINDNAIDSPKLKHKALAVLYRPMMKKAEQVLTSMNALQALRSCLSVNEKNEAAGVSALSQACEPTETCYTLATLEIAKTRSTLPQSTIELLGRYLGRCVYLVDAIEDMDEDVKEKRYNVLNLISRQEHSTRFKRDVIAECLHFLKPMRLEITDKLRSLPDDLRFHSLPEKWESLFLSIENQLSKLITPLNDSRLVNMLASFSSASITNCATGSCLSIEVGDNQSGPNLCGFFRDLLNNCVTFNLRDILGMFCSVFRKKK